MKQKIKIADLLTDMEKRSDKNLKDILIFIGQDIWFDYSEVARDIRAELKRRKNARIYPITISSTFDA